MRGVELARFCSRVVAAGVAEKRPEQTLVHRARQLRCATWLVGDRPGEPTAVLACRLDEVVLGEALEERRVRLDDIERLLPALLPAEEVLVEDARALQRHDRAGRPDAEGPR